MTDGRTFNLAGFHHVQLVMPRGQEAAAEAFYAGLLGLERVAKPQELEARGGCWFRGEGVEVHLDVEEPFRPARKAHPAFLVNGLDALRTRLASAGATPVDDVPLDGLRRCHAFEPFGNRLELVETDPGSG